MQDNSPTNTGSDLLKISSKYHAKIKKLCEPLTEHFGVDYFSYNHIHTDGTYHCVINRPEIGEDYLEQQAFLYDPFLKHPNAASAGLTIWEEIPSVEFTHYLRRTRNGLKTDLGFLFVEKDQDKTIIFGVSATRKYSNQLSHYLNEFALFRRFFQYYAQETKQMMNESKSTPFELLPILNHKFHEHAFIDSAKITLDDRTKFMNHLSPQASCPKHLTVREKQCLQALLEGYTAKQAGIRLGLSYRTVEHFFDALKLKFACKNQSQLFQKAKELSLYGLL